MALETKNTEGMTEKPTLREIKSENSKLKKSIETLQKTINKQAKQSEARLTRIRTLCNRLVEELGQPQPED